MTPELRALQDELQERLAGPVDHHQSTEDTQRDWTDIRRAYAHHVDRANGWDLPTLPAVPLRQRVTIAVQTELAAGTFEAVRDEARRAIEALNQANPSLGHPVEVGLTVVDEHHATTDEQLARFISAAAGGDFVLTPWQETVLATAYADGLPESTPQPGRLARVFRRWFR